MIEIKNLKVSYGSKVVLQLESLDLEAGKITAIVGLNGSGKSTLLKSIVGIKGYEGSVLINGKQASKLGHKKRATFVSYLPQIFPAANMDIITLVSHGRFPYLGYSKILGEEDLELVENALRITDLWEIREKSLLEISGGERQRAYLAMVIAQNTKFILLDEPATYMDIKHQIEIMDVLKKLADQGRGIIFSSHDLPQSFSVCDKVCLLKKGELVAVGQPDILAADYEKMRSAMGVCLQKNESECAVYRFNLCK